MMYNENNRERKKKKEMKIAVTYDNGEVFQHFGHTETFKVYEVEDHKIVSSEILGSNGRLETDEKFKNRLLECDSIEKMIAVLAEHGLSVDKEELLSLAAGFGDNEVKKLLTDEDLEAASGGVAGVDDFIVWISKKVRDFINN